MGFKSLLKPYILQFLVLVSMVMWLKHIKSQLGSLLTGWTVEEDSFKSATPRGLVTFTNVLAVLDPLAPRRLLLACHYDSKFFPPDSKNPKRVFLGASDSAVPCSMILELITVLDVQLNALKQQVSPRQFYEFMQTDSFIGKCLLLFL